MQIRPYPEKDGLRIWLNRIERRELLEAVDEEPRRRMALQLGLHGLRTDEVVQVTPGDVRQLGDSDRYALVVEGKTGRRRTPISEDLHQRIRYLKSAAQLRKSDPVIDVSKRQVRNWIGDACEVVAGQEPDDEQAALWDSVSMHDLRRSWATDGYYSLAVAGVPIAEQLIMSYGGWAQTESGRDTFRKHYLGPVPDHVARRTLEDLGLN